MTRTRWTGAVAGLLLVLIGPPVQAQSPAESFFHEAAQQYVAGDVAAARRTVEQGLAVAPSDPRLLALQNKLERQDAGQEGSRSSSSGRRGRRSGEQAEEGRREKSRSGTMQKSRARSGNSRSSDRSTQRFGQGRDDSRDAAARPLRRDPSASQSRAQNEDRSRDGRGLPGNILSRGQAARLLRAVRNQEETLLREIRIQTLEKKQVEKDW